MGAQADWFQSKNDVYIWAALLADTQQKDRVSKKFYLGFKLLKFGDCSLLQHDRLWWLPKLSWLIQEINVLQITFSDIIPYNSITLKSVGDFQDHLLKPNYSGLGFYILHDRLMTNLINTELLQKVAATFL